MLSWLIFFCCMGDLLMTTTKNILNIIAFKLLFILTDTGKIFQSSGKTKKNGGGKSGGNCTESRPAQCEEVVNYKQSD